MGHGSWVNIRYVKKEHQWAMEVGSTLEESSTNIKWVWEVGSTLGKPETMASRGSRPSIPKSTIEQTERMA